VGVHALCQPPSSILLGAYKHNSYFGHLPSRRPTKEPAVGNMEPTKSQKNDTMESKVKTILELLESFHAMTSALLEEDEPIHSGNYHDRKRFATFI